MKIQPFYIFIGLFVGFFFIYVFNPKPKIIISEMNDNKVTPSLQNAGKITYVDDDGVCYKYKKIRIKC
jgi:hypothetical protein